jgi:membrane protein implicated in regulation of membrane protease activity
VNTTLFTSRHAVLAALLCAAFVGWMLFLGCSPGSRAGADPGFVLWTGWIALFLMVVVTVYTLRKYVHRLRLDPAVRKLVTYEQVQRVARQMEQVEASLAELRIKIRKGLLQDPKEALLLANKILKDQGVFSRMEARVESGKEVAAPFAVRLHTRQPLGRVSRWLHVHLYYGLLAGVLVLLHGRYSFASPLGAALSLLTFLVIGTGVLGVWLFAAGPAWITRLERDLTIEEGFVLERHFSSKLESIRNDKKLDPVVKILLRDLDGAGAAFVGKATEALTLVQKQEPASQQALRDALVLMSQRSRVLSGYRSLQRMRWLMNAWRLVHIPATVLLLAMTAVHILSVAWY